MTGRPGSMPTVAWWDGEAVPAWCAAQTCALGPTLADLLKWPRGDGGGIVALQDAQGLAALLPLSVQQRKIRGVPLTVAALVGDDFFDYLPGVCRPGFSLTDATPALRSWGRRQGWDALELRHQWPINGISAEDPQWQLFSNRFFDAAQDAAGWAFLTRKDSLKRHRNRAKRFLGYGVEHYRGEIPEAILAEAAALHRERWGFDGIASLFDAPGRAALYRQRAAQAWVTVVRDGAVAMAVHLGFRHGDAVLWHTPVVNIRYLDHSPLEVLLLETVEACAREAVQVLDFGLGDEAYKERFSNSVRVVGNFLLPLTWRGGLAGLLRRQAWLQGGGARLRHWLERCRWRGAAGGEPQRYGKSLASVGAEGRAWRSLDDFPAFVDFARSQGMPIRREHYERFRRGLIYLCRADEPSSGSGLWGRFEGETGCLEVEWPGGTAGEATEDALAALQSWAVAQRASRLVLELPAGRSVDSPLVRAGFARQSG